MVYPQTYLRTFVLFTTFCKGKFFLGDGISLHLDHDGGYKQLHLLKLIDIYIKKSEFYFLLTFKNAQ